MSTPLSVLAELSAEHSPDIILFLFEGWFLIVLSKRSDDGARGGGVRDPAMM